MSNERCGLYSTYKTLNTDFEHYYYIKPAGTTTSIYVFILDEMRLINKSKGIDIMVTMVTMQKYGKI